MTCLTALQTADDHSDNWDQMKAGNNLSLLWNEE